MPDHENWEGVMTGRQVASPDGRELQRARCRHGCDYEVAIALWCASPACCDQSPEGFIDGLTAAQEARGVTVFALRYLDPLPPPGEYDPDVRVRLWRAGGLSPVFTGRSADAVLFEMEHDCPVIAEEPPL